MVAGSNADILTREVCNHDIDEHQTLYDKLSVQDMEALEYVVVRLLYLLYELLSSCRGHL